MRLKSIIRALGPGLLWAGAAIGVSHLVQSTRAGAEFGFYLVGVLILANLMKYPFFEFAPRYAIATGNNLVTGYRKISKALVVLFFVLTLSTMFTIQAAVTTVTAGIIGNVAGLSTDPFYISIALLILCMVILIIGKYSILDRVIKVIIILLTLSTLIAVIASLSSFTGYKTTELQLFDWNNLAHMMFLFAFVGWMPAPIDVSVWHSFWTLEKKKKTKGESLGMKGSLLDFNIGFFGTAALAIGFLSLGALLMYGSGEQFSDKGVVFSGQLMNLYTSSIGNWAYPVIAVAAITTMVSTTLTCFDAYPRVLVPVTEILFNKEKQINKNRGYFIWLLILGLGTISFIGLLSSTMRFMVDLATTISVVTAPVFAILNFVVIKSKQMPMEYKPRPWLSIYAIVSLVFLVALSVGYLYYRFFSG